MVNHNDLKALIESAEAVIAAAYQVITPVRADVSFYQDRLAASIPLPPLNKEED